MSPKANQNGKAAKPVAPGSKPVASSYSMAEVVRETGIGEHTLRAWERRYSAVVPERSDGGSRRYSAADLRRLRLLRRVVESGYRIGDVASLDLAALEARVAVADDTPSHDIEALMTHVRTLDGDALTSALEAHQAASSVREFAETIVMPLLRTIGLAWERGDVSIACEHCASAAIRGVLDDSLRSLQPTATLAAATRRVLCATPSQERHELGALAAATVAAAAGAHVTYLGGDLPTEEIIQAAREVAATDVCIGAVAMAPGRLSETIAALAVALPELRLMVGGAAASGLDLGRCRRLANLEELESALSSP